MTSRKRQREPGNETTETPLEPGPRPHTEGLDALLLSGASSAAAADILPSSTLVKSMAPPEAKKAPLEDAKANKMISSIISILFAHFDEMLPYLKQGKEDPYTNFGNDTPLSIRNQMIALYLGQWSKIFFRLSDLESTLQNQQTITSKKIGGPISTNLKQDVEELRADRNMKKDEHFASAVEKTASKISALIRDMS